MSITEIRDLEQGSEEWLAARRGMVTASVVGRLITTKARTGIDYPCGECGAVTGSPCLAKRAPYAPIQTLHKGRTAAASADATPPELEVARGDDARRLTMTLAAERITGWTEPVFVSSAMWRGIEDEPRAVEVYSQNREPVTTTGFLMRDDWGFAIGYSPDGLVGSDGLIECKSRDSKSQLATILADQVPGYNMAQLQCGLLVSDRAWIDYVSYCGGMPLYIKRVFPDPRWFAVIVAAVETFERDAADILARYHEVADLMPTTERIIEQEVTF